MPRRPQGTSTAPRRGPSSSCPGPKDRHEPLQLVIRYKGGAECWWRIDARGETYILPGCLAIEDVFKWIYDGNPGVARGGSYRSKRRR